MKFKIPELFKRKWFIFILVVIVIFAIYFFFQNKSKKSNLPETAVVSRQDIQDIVSTSGAISAGKRVSLRFQAPGKLVWVGVKKGDHVSKWQAIASLDQRQLQKDLEKSLLTYNSTRMDFDETTKTTYKDTALNQSIERILKKSQNGLDISVLNVELTALASEYANLYSPIEGIVVKATDEYAGVNTSATTEYQIVDPTTLRFEAEIEELDIAKVKAGDNVTVTLDSLPNEPIQGQISEIEFTSSVTTSGNTAYKAYIPLTLDARYRLDMNGDADIVVSQKTNVLVVPTDMVSEDDQGQFVIIKLGENFEKVYIKTGIETDNYFEILEGIDEGATIYQPTEEISKILQAKK